jgi:acyl carrier protein
MSTAQELDPATIADCLVRCARSALQIKGEHEPPRLDLDLIDGQGLRFGDYVMDSLGFVAWMTELEDELDLPMMDFADTERTRTLGGLAAAVLEDSDPDTLRGFVERWSEGT